MFESNEHNLTLDSTREEVESCEVLVTELSLTLETEWKAAYDDRRRQWRVNTTASATGHKPIAEVRTTNEQLTGLRTSYPSVTEQHRVSQTTIGRHTLPSEVNSPFGLDLFIHSIVPSLNVEQERAFRIVAKQALTPAKEQLRMYLGSAGGTGKSHVIHALKSFFDTRKQSRRFRLASYTGVAASNISGVTLHAALCIGQ
ncbi:hypothetical protein K435DRAFT_657731, partial [Dendrothele bispora CBS 962.96]